MFGSMKIFPNRFMWFDINENGISNVANKHRWKPKTTQPQKQRERVDQKVSANERGGRR